MAIEILGFTIKPELSIGDIAAIGALIASPLIFYFGYIRTRKSEQIETAREFMDRIYTKTQGIRELGKPPAYPGKGEYLEQHEREKPNINWIKKYRQLLRQLLDEIEYFSYLVKKHEIEDKNILDYYAPKVYATLQSVEHGIQFLKEEEKNLETLSLTHDDPRLKELMALWKEKLKDETSIDS